MYDEEPDAFTNRLNEGLEYNKGVMKRSQTMFNGGGRGRSTTLT